MCVSVICNTTRREGGTGGTTHVAERCMKCIPKATQMSQVRPQIGMHETWSVKQSYYDRQESISPCQPGRRQAAQPGQRAKADGQRRSRLRTSLAQLARVLEMRLNACHMAIGN